VLAQEARREAVAMRHLAEKSTLDAAAMKVLTVITLIYLPTTVVTNFFSTSFVLTDIDGNMRLARSTWIMFVIAVPLTLITLIIWMFWANSSGRRLVNSIPGLGPIVSEPAWIGDRDNSAPESSIESSYLPSRSTETMRHSGRSLCSGSFDEATSTGRHK
jgi:hypothetical protein